MAYRGGKGLRETAREYGVSKTSVGQWADEYGSPAGAGPTMEGAAMTTDNGDDDLPDNPEELKRMVRDQQLELELDLMREVVDLVKKDPAADPRWLTNREKTALADRLRPTHSLTCLASRLGLALSSYHYHHARARP